MPADPWLRRWLPRLSQACAGAPVLEIGCGAGADTVELLRAGLPVVAFDLSPQAVASARRAAPEATISVQSVLDPFPLEGTGIGAVVASLSLHYFPWPKTEALLARIHATLRPGGLLLCRLNSTEDVHYGAVGHPEIERGLFLVDGQPKRFFGEADVLALFARGWQVLSREHLSSLKYEHPKRLWEVVAAREG